MSKFINYNVSDKHAAARIRATAALPEEDPAEISAIINPDGTVNTYNNLTRPDYITYAGQLLRDKVHAVLTGTTT